MDKIRLRSGRELLIRPITPGDAAALQASHDRLSAQAQYRRFLAPKTHLSPAEVRYLVDIDGFDHVALVATPADDPALIIAVARFVRLTEDPLAAEFAIVVGDQYQGEGLASELLARLASAATERGITRFRATMLSDNEPARRLMRRLSERFSTRRHGSIDEVDIELAA